MRILISSRAFLPLYGGLEQVMASLAEEFAKAGHSVTVAAENDGPEEGPGYRVVRRPGARGLYRLARAAEVCLSANVSLNTAPPLLASRRPLVISHQGLYPRNLNGAAKRLTARLATNIFCSAFVKRALGLPGVVVPNTYRHGVFVRGDQVDRTEDMIAFGRMVSDKGFHLPIEALAWLRDQSVHRRLTLTGDGPERARLEQLAQRLGVADRVRFTGALTGGALAREIARHQTCIIPSVWEEPFGIVALEALACGVQLIVARTGGLPEASGPGAVFFVAGDAKALAAALARPADQVSPALAAAQRAFLDQHAPAAIAARYLDVLRLALLRTEPH